MEEQYKKIWKKKDESDVKEKHVPVVNVEEGEEIKIEVKIGDTEHPMEKEHFIQWIEVLDGERSIEKIYLSPLSKPKVTFYLKQKPENLKVREFCNLHGFWQYE